MNFTIRLEHFPERIVSLVPSQTELLYYLGLGDRVTGITKFCIHPDEWFRTKTRVGGTKNLHLDVIDSLKPDLIIGNKEENTESDIVQLREKYPVYMSDIFTVPDALQMIADVGTLTGKVNESHSMIQAISNDFSNFPKAQGSVLYLIWADPYMAACNHTFIGDMLKNTGLTNCIDGEMERYVALNQKQIAALKPDYIFLSSEPFPFKEQHAADLQKITPAKILFTDGELFSWYGSRMLQMKDYFTGLCRQLKDN